MRNLDRRLEVMEEAELRRLNAELGELLAQEIWPYLTDAQLEALGAGDFTPMLALPAGAKATELSARCDQLVLRNAKFSAIVQEMINEAIPL